SVFVRMMRTKFALLVVLTFVCAAAQSAVRIPLEEDQGQFWIEGRIGNSEPLLIALDTGAGATVIHQPVAEKLGLQPRRTSTLGGAGGRVASGIIERVDVTLGGVQLNDLTLQAIDLGPIHARSGKQTAMIIGYDVLRRYVTEIDYDTHELVLHEPRTY